MLKVPTFDKFSKEYFANLHLTFFFVVYQKERKRVTSTNLIKLFAIYIIFFTLHYGKYKQIDRFSAHYNYAGQFILKYIFYLNKIQPKSDPGMNKTIDTFRIDLQLQIRADKDKDDAHLSMAMVVMFTKSIPYFFSHDFQIFSQIFLVLVSFLHQLLHTRTLMCILQWNDCILAIIMK